MDKGAGSGIFKRPIAHPSAAGAAIAGLVLVGGYWGSHIAYEGAEIITVGSTQIIDVMETISSET